jgi:hypothetical protein
MTQLVEGCKGALLQLLVCAKSLLATIAETVRADEPTLVTVMVCGAVVTPIDWLPKSRLEDESCTVEVLPVRATTWVTGTLFSVSPMMSEPLRSPTAVGLNVTLNLHCAPEATLPPQVVV